MLTRIQDSNMMISFIKKIFSIARAKNINSIHVYRNTFANNMLHTHANCLIKNNVSCQYDAMSRVLLQQFVAVASLITCSCKVVLDNPACPEIAIGLKYFPMKYRRYGKTGLNLSAFTFGAMRICFDETKVIGADRDRAEANAIETMRKALELGINHIDTARDYGNSERLIGMGLEELGRDNFYITTKLDAAKSYDETSSHIDESLERMKIDRIDILDAHGINTTEKLNSATSPDGCIKAMQDARDDGKVAHIAFSTHSGPELIIKTLETGLFEAVSLHYYITYRRNAAAVEKAKELDMGVLILSPSEKSGLLYRPTSELSDVCDPVTPLVLNHRWMLSNPGVSTVTIGAANPEEFEAHMAGVDCPDELSDEDLAAVERWELAEKQLLGDKRCTICFKCMPCPQNVAIPEILRLRNLACAFDMIEFGKMRYNLLGCADDWFPGEKSDMCNQCGDCLPKCPEKLDIPELLRETEEILKDMPRKRLWDK